MINGFTFSWSGALGFMSRFAACGGAIALASSCTPRPTIQPTPHFVLGTAYQAGGVWHYPAESYDLRQTGLASVLPDRSSRLTTDGEIFDQAAMAAAHPTLQLPAIARITNLESGRAVRVRINDRGTGSPRRLIEVSSRVATLLGIPPRGVAQVRLEVLPNESHAAADALPGAPRLDVAPAPRAVVETSALLPLPGTRQGNGRVATMRALPLLSPEFPPNPLAATRLPEQVEQVAAQPGRLWVQLDTFQEYRYAVMQRARLAGFQPTIVPIQTGRTRSFRVQVGPVASVGEADAVLDQALAAGIPDARIVVE